MLEQLPNSIHDSQVDKHRVRKELWRIFSILNTQIEKPILLSSPLFIMNDEILATIAMAIVLLSPKEERQAFISEFRTMLHTGGFWDQAFAVKALCLLSPRINIEQELAKHLIRALRSPYDNVRQSALDALQTQHLDSDQLNQIMPVLETGLQSFSIWRGISTYMSRFFAGKGQIGIDLYEKEILINTIKKIDASYSEQKLERTLAGLVDKPVRSVTKGIHDNLSILRLKFDSQLDRGVVDKLFSIYLRWASQIEEARRKSKKDDGLLVAEKISYLGLFVNGAKRFDEEGKGRISHLLLEELTTVNDEYALSSLLNLVCKFDAHALAISMETRARFLKLLEHSEWHVSDAALEAALHCNLI
jgi:hypothetical protein